VTEPGPEQGVGLVHAAGTGDVDLDQPAVDHVETGDHQAVRAEHRAERADDRPIVVVDVRGRDRRADPEVVDGRAPQDRAGDLAVQQEQPLVALRNGRQVLLGDHVPAAAGGRRLQQRGGAPVVAHQPDADPREPVHRLHDRRTDAAHERPQCARIGTDVRRRAQLGKLQRDELLVHRPNPRRPVDDARPGAFDDVQQVRRV